MGRMGSASTGSPGPAYRSVTRELKYRMFRCPLEFQIPDQPVATIRSELSNQCLGTMETCRIGERYRELWQSAWHLTVGLVDAGEPSRESKSTRSIRPSKCVWHSGNTHFRVDVGVFG